MAAKMLTNYKKLKGIDIKGGVHEKTTTTKRRRFDNFGLQK